MTLLKEQLSDFKEYYEKAEKLVEEESKQDPPTEPYRSHYAAYDILIEMQTQLNGLLQGFEIVTEEDFADDADLRKEQSMYRYILGFIYKDTGRICVWTDELANAEKNLMNCIQLLDEYKLNPECVNAYVGALNQIGIVWSTRQDPGKAKEFLERAEKTCLEFKLKDVPPMSIYDVFGALDEVENGKGLDIFEKTYTLTLFYLAQVLGQLGDIHQSARYCHTTLRRQLEFNDYEPIDWALNSATLSQYYCSNDRNTEARHHLAAASYILAKYETEMITDGMSEDEKGSVMERFNHRSADVMRCWGKYGLNLLLESKNRLMGDFKVDDNVDTTQQSTLCRFNNIDNARYEVQITDQYCLMFDDAKAVFMAVQNYFKAAKEYYTAESEASEYAKIIQDLSSSYKYLAFFEFDEANQCKLHKRRADLLEDLLKILNPLYYMSICRELWYELGLTYTSMLDIKLEMFDRVRTTKDASNSHSINKINSLSNKSIDRFQSFINSYKQDGTDELQTTLSDDERAPIMFAYFQIGRLYYKLMTSERTLQIENIQNSLKYYKMFVMACEEYESIGKTMKGEYGVCKEMTELLPIKIRKLETQVDV